MDAEPTLYYNAVVHTMDATPQGADALLVRGGRIAAVGAGSDLEAPAIRRVDLEGQTVIPGFNDSHCHILGIGLALQLVDVSVDAVRSIVEIERAVARRTREVPPHAWILGRGYDQNMLAERRHPTRTDLDRAAPNHPVVLLHTSGHVLTCNSRALQAGGVTAGTPDPAGGQIDRDGHGAPTGLLKEAAMELVDAAIPQPSPAEGAGAIARAAEMMARYGITSASDAATGSGPSIDPQLEMYRLAASRRLPVRITLMPQIHYVAPPNDAQVRPPADFQVGERREWLAIGCTKIFSDGALSTRTAAVRTPYAESPDNFGILLWEQSTLEDTARRAHVAGWHIATHALGDRAVEAVLDAYAKALDAAPRAGHRHRIEHCMLLDEGLARRIKQLGVAPSLQPDIFRLGDGYVTALGMERASESIPMALFRRLRIPVAFSSDAPVIPCDPLDVVRSAVERKTPGGTVLGPHHAVTAMEAIRLYTSGGAYITHTDTQKGTLRPGMLADFTMLSGDPATLPVKDLGGLRVTMTVAGGVQTYRE